MTIGQILFGLSLVILGLLFILDNVELINLDFGIIWPLAMVLIGVYIILRDIETYRRHKQFSREGEQVE